MQSLAVEYQLGQAINRWIVARRPSVQEMLIFVFASVFGTSGEHDGLAQPPSVRLQPEGN